MKTWLILGLDPTCDEKIIKRAYAKRLKTCHPEDDPEAYQELREAYERALYLSRLEFNENVDDDYETEFFGDSYDVPIEHEEQEAVEKRLYDDYNTDEAEINPYYEVESSIQCMQKLYMDYDQRLQKENWELILSEDVFWKLESKERSFWLATEALLDMPYMPSEIWMLFESHFHWLDREMELSYYLGEEASREIIGRIKDIKPFIYPPSHVLGKDHDEYFGKLDAIYKANKERQLDKASDLLEEAMLQYLNDPNFHLMYGEYALYADKYKERYNHFKHVKVLSPENIRMRLYMARLLLNANMDNQAVEEYEEILKFAPDNKEALLSLSEGLMKVGRLSEGYKNCMDMVTAYPHDSGVLIHVNKVIRFLLEVLWQHPFNLSLVKMIRELSDKTGLSYSRERLAWPFRCKRMGVVILKMLGLAFASVILIGIIVCGHIFGMVIAWHVGKAILKQSAAPKPSFGN